MDAWLERARERTAKHLREEVEGVEMLARVSGDGSVLGPPEDDVVREVAALESQVLSGKLFREEAPKSQMSGGEGEKEQEESVVVPRGAGKVTLLVVEGRRRIALQA